MREIEVSQITDVVEKLCIEANEHLPEDVKCAIRSCRACEDGEIAQGVLDNIIENFEIADSECVPICQDTGMACVFLEIGQDVHLVGGDLTEAVNEGVRRGYDKGYLRKSVVKDPVRRGNTGDNTPAMLYTEIVPGENIKITVGPKGFGSENMSQIRMFKPSAGLQGIKDFILEVVETAGPNPCPPMVVGVGIGGAAREEGADAPARFRESRPVLRGPRKGDAREGQPARHRPAGLRRQDDGDRPQHRDDADAHRRHAVRRQHQLPRDASQDGGALKWKSISSCP